MNLSKIIAEQLSGPKGFLGRFIFLPLLNFGNDRLITSVLQRLKLEPNDTYLDIGFGGGKSLLLAKNILKTDCIKGVDPSEESINFFQNKSPEIKVFLNSSEDLPFENNYFSKISTINTIYFLPDINKSLQEIKRVLKKEGILAIGFLKKRKWKNFQQSQTMASNYLIQKKSKLS